MMLHLQVSIKYEEPFLYGKESKCRDLFLYYYLMLQLGTYCAMLHLFRSLHCVGVCVFICLKLHILACEANLPEVQRGVIVKMNHMSNNTSHARTKSSHFMHGFFEN